MMDKYNHWLGKFFGLINGQKRFAITLGQTTYYSVSEETIGPAWRFHEDWHKYQWAMDGVIKFSLLYVWYLIRYGYYDNPYEVEAREMERSQQEETNP
jgi:hypothetical protein